MPIKDSSFSSDNPPVPSVKKPYEKPSFRFEQVFVTSALTCGKITSTQSGCGLNTKSS
jgi:hypothetical protein